MHKKTPVVRRKKAHFLGLNSVLVWRKWLPGEKLNLWLTKLPEKWQNRVVITFEHHLAKARLDIYPQNKKEACNLKSKYGGRILILAPTIWWNRQKPRSYPLNIGRKLLVVQSEAEAQKIQSRVSAAPILIIPSGLAFGTGEHATTRMCLEFLVECAPFDSMLDAGTGSGILAIAARILHCKQVCAFDSDPVSVRVAREYAQLNDVTFELREDSLEKFSIKSQVEVLTANILSEALIKNRTRLLNAVQPGGFLILSGIRKNERTSVQEAFSASDLNASAILRAQKQSEGWCCLLLQRNR